jgi:putative ABC transport system permease protein
LQAGRAWVVIKGPAALTLGDTARRIVRDLDPEVPVTLTTMQGALDQVLSARRFTLWLVGAFGLAAFLLAASGVYGLMSFVVGQSSREMGIRLALGATPGELVRLVVGRGVVLALTGAGVGLAVGLLAVEALDGLLFGVTPTDPLTLAASSLLVSASAILASYLPARRLLHTSPASALRHG